jgi:CcmD family protein
MINNIGYVAAAFAVVWFGLVLYVFFLMRREKTLRRDIEVLSETEGQNKT